MAEPAEVNIKIHPNTEGQVEIVLSVPVSGMTLPPAQAEAIARSLMTAAHMARAAGEAPEPGVDAEADGGGDRGRSPKE